MENTATQFSVPDNGKVSIDPQYLPYYMSWNMQRQTKMWTQSFHTMVISGLVILLWGWVFYYGVILLVLSFRITDLPFYLSTTPMCTGTHTHAHAQYKHSTPVLAYFQLGSPRGFQEEWEGEL